MSASEVSDYLFRHNDAPVGITWFYCKFRFTLFRASCFFIVAPIFSILLCSSNHLLQFEFTTRLLQNETFLIYFGLWLIVCRCWFFISFVVKAFCYYCGFLYFYQEKKVSRLELILFFSLAFFYIVFETFILLWWSPGIDDLFRAAGYVEPFRWMYLNCLVTFFGYAPEFENLFASETLPFIHGSSKALKILITEGYVADFFKSLEYKTILKETIVHLENLKK